MFSAVRQSHVARLVTAMVAVAAFTAGPASAQESDSEGTICILLGPPNDICVDHPLDG